MKTLLCIFSLIVFQAISFSQQEQLMVISRQEQLMATAETMTSTFNIEGDKLSGTCFMVTKDGVQYFVTAAHLFKSSHKSGDLVPMQLFIQNQWQFFNGRIYFHADRNVDIALVKLSENVSQRIQLPEEFLKQNYLPENVAQVNGISLDTALTAFGVEVFFYGFSSRT